MKRKITILFLLTALTLGGCAEKTATVETEERVITISDNLEDSNGYIYSVKARGEKIYAIIEEYTGTERNLVLPDTLGGYPVTTISSAFEENQNLESVTIPETVEYIWTHAFSDCSNLSEVSIADSTIITSAYSFNGTPWLENMKAENPLVIVNNMLIDGSGAEGDIKIPAGVTYIAQHAFNENSDITSVAVPDGVYEIASCAFTECNSMENIDLPESLTKLGSSAFFKCSSLKSIRLPENLATIEYNTFSGCTSLTDIVIPSGVRSIESDAFKYTPWLQMKIAENPYVIINNILIDGSAVKGEVVIPQGVRIIGSDAFELNTEITKVTIPDSVEIIDLSAFSRSGITEVVIPDSVVSIEMLAFDKCDNLKKITLSKNLKEVGEWAFEENYNLTEITIPDSVDIELFHTAFDCSGIYGEPPELIAHYKGNKYIYDSEISNFVIAE